MFFHFIFHEGNSSVFLLGLMWTLLWNLIIKGRWMECHWIFYENVSKVTKVTKEYSEAFKEQKKEEIGIVWKRISGHDKKAISRLHRFDLVKEWKEKLCFQDFLWLWGCQGISFYEFLKIFFNLNFDLWFSRCLFIKSCKKKESEKKKTHVWKFPLNSRQVSNMLKVWQA